MSVIKDLNGWVRVKMAEMKEDNKNEPKLKKPINLIKKLNSVPFKLFTDNHPEISQETQ
jgi:hypothetical protein